MSSARTQMRPSLTSPANTWAIPSRPGLRTKNLNDAIRVHDGPVATATTTNVEPREVMKRVKQVLEANMKLQIYPEGEFKYRCVRVKREGEGVSETTAAAASTTGKGSDPKLPGGNRSTGSSEVSYLSDEVLTFSVTSVAGGPQTRASTRGFLWNALEWSE